MFSLAKFLIAFWFNLIVLGILAVAWIYGGIPTTLLSWVLFVFSNAIVFTVLLVGNFAIKGVKEGDKK